MPPKINQPPKNQPHNSIFGGLSSPFSSGLGTGTNQFSSGTTSNLFQNTGLNNPIAKPTTSSAEPIKGQNVFKSPNTSTNMFEKYFGGGSLFAKAATKDQNIKQEANKQSPQSTLFGIHQISKLNQKKNIQEQAAKKKSSFGSQKQAQSSFIGPNITTTTNQFTGTGLFANAGNESIKSKNSKSKQARVGDETSNKEGLFSKKQSRLDNETIKSNFPSFTFNVKDNKQTVRAPTTSPQIFGSQLNTQTLPKNQELFKKQPNTQTLDRMNDKIASVQQQIKQKKQNITNLSSQPKQPPKQPKQPKINKKQLEQKIKKDLQSQKQFISKEQIKQKLQQKRNQIKKQIVDTLNTNKRPIVLQNHRIHVDTLIENRIDDEDKKNKQLKKHKLKLQKQISQYEKQIKQLINKQNSLSIPKTVFNQIRPSVDFDQYWQTISKSVIPQEMIKMQAQEQKYRLQYEKLQKQVEQKEKKLKAEQQAVSKMEVDYQTIELQLIDIFTESAQLKAYCEGYFGRKRKKLEQEYKKLSQQIKKMKKQRKSAVRSSINYIY